jgi:hypothetical protein
VCKEETGFAKGICWNDVSSKCTNDNWGYYIDLSAGGGTFDLTAGAAHCGDGTSRGSVTITSTGGGCYSITYTMSDDYLISLSQVNIGCVVPGDPTADLGGVGPNCNMRGKYNYNNALQACPAIKGPKTISNICKPAGCASIPATYIIVHAETWQSTTDCGTTGKLTC